MNHAELLTALTALSTQIIKVNTEIQGQLAALNEAIANADNVSQPIIDAVTALTAGLQTLDDITPDAVPVP